MSDQNNVTGQPGEEALAASDSLGLLRQVIAASSSSSVRELVGATVNALMSHQDIDGCEVVVVKDATGCREPAADIRDSSGIPPVLAPWLLTEIIPVVLETAETHREAALHHHTETLTGCVLAVPIGTGAETIGSLAAWNKDPNDFLPWHETLLEMVAEVLLLVLQRLSAAYRNPTDSTTPENRVGRTAIHGRPVQPEQGWCGTMDPLTGLPDRQAFELRLNELSALPVPAFRSCFVFYLDIDRFRLIRDYGGHMTAERVIRTLTEVLRHEIGTELALGRLGIDEFGAVVEGHSLEQAVALADALVHQVDAFRMTFSGQRYDVSISVGVAQLDTRWGSGPTALRRAMRACRVAQSLGGGTVQVYHQRMNKPRDAGDDGWVLNQLTHALKNDGLELYAQLISPSSADQGNESNCLYMHELLLRLRDENGELCSAGAFLPMAERYGLSAKLDRWVVQAAFQQIAKSSFASNPQHRFTLNLSGHSIDNHQLLDFISQQFEVSGLSPERICFEITETAAISDIAAAKEFVEALKGVGCQFALDDFGSGHSSFLYLRDLPVDYLKVDGELVRKIVDDPVSLALVRTIHGVGRLMGRRTIAEYVENQAIYDAIGSIGCDYAQGYWIGSPVPLVDILFTPPAQT